MPCSEPRSAPGAATVASAVRPFTAQADDGQAIILGEINEHSDNTEVRNSGNPGTYCVLAGRSAYGLLGANDQSGRAGVRGQTVADAGYGVWGEGVGSSHANAVGVLGSTGGHYSQIGVRGIADPEGIGVHGKTANGVGVRGEAPGGWGVHGMSGNRAVFGEASTGVGVYGSATTGIAMQASTPVSNGIHTGYALRASGKIKLDNCAGVATIASGTNNVTVTPGLDLTALSAVVATLQGFPAGRRPCNAASSTRTTNKFTIYLTANSINTVKVAWHVFG